MTQYARPASDISNGGGFTTSPFYSKLNDSNDTTVVRNANGNTGVLEVKLGSVTDPLVSTGHVVHVHAQATGSSAAEKQTVLLYQGATLIATCISGGNVSRTAQTDYSYTLSGAEADAITDYTDLRLRISASTVGASEYISWAEAWLELPDGVTIVTADAAAGRTKGWGTAPQATAWATQTGAGHGRAKARASAVAAPITVLAPHGAGTGDKVQSTVCTGGGTPTAANVVFASPATVGNLVLIVAGTNDTTSGLDDPAGWTPLGEGVSGALNVQIFAKAGDGTTMSTDITSGGGTNGSNRQAAMAEYDVPFANVSWETPVQASGSAVTQLAVGPVTPATLVSLVFSGIYIANTAGGDPPFTVTNGFTVDQTGFAGTGARTGIARKMVTDASSTSTTWSWTTARNAVGVIQASAMSLRATTGWARARSTAVGDVVTGPVTVTGAASAWATGRAGVAAAAITTSSAGVGYVTGRAAVVSSVVTSSTAQGWVTGRGTAAGDRLVPIWTGAAQGWTKARGTAAAAVVTASAAAGRARARGTSGSYCIVTAGTQGGGETVLALRAISAEAGPNLSIVVSKPSGTAEGDLMVAVITYFGTYYNLPVPAISTAPSGWTQQTLTVDSYYHDPEDFLTDVWGTAVYTKVAGASEPTTYTWTLVSSDQGNAGYGRIATYIGANATPVGQKSTINTGNAPSITTTGGNDELFYGGRSLNPGSASPPTGMTERWDSNTYAADEDFLTAGATGNRQSAQMQQSALLEMNPSGAGAASEAVKARFHGWGASAGITIRSAAGSGRAKARATADSSVIAGAVTVTGTGAGWARLRGTSAGVVTTANAAQGFAHARGTGAAAATTTGTSAGWGRVRGAADAYVTTTGVAVGRAWGRTASAGQPITTSGSAQSWVTLRATADATAFYEGVVVTGQASGRIATRASVVASPFTHTSTAVGRASTHASTSSLVTSASAAQGRTSAHGTATSIVTASASAVGRARLNGAAAGTRIVSAPASGRAATRAAVTSLVTTTAIAQGRAQIRAGGVASLFVAASAAQGRAKVRSSVAWLEIGVITGSGVGRTSARGQAVASAITTTAQAQGRFNVRAVVVAIATTTASAQGRIRARATADGTSFYPGFTITADPASGRGRVRATSSGTKVLLSLAQGYAHSRATSSGLSISSSSAQGRAKIRATTVSSPLTTTGQGVSRGHVYSAVDARLQTTNTSYGWVKVYAGADGGPLVVKASVIRKHGEYNGHIDRHGEYNPTISKHGEHDPVLRK